MSEAQRWRNDKGVPPSRTLNAAAGCPVNTLVSDEGNSGGSSDGGSDMEQDEDDNGRQANDSPGAGLPPSGQGGHVIVVGVLGEPNVGKSSTINALLGAHKARRTSD